MITPLIANGVVRWGTKMGVTDVSRPVEEFINSHEEYDEFAKIAIACGMTPIFEWCSRKQKIVLDYAEDQLILTAMRNTVTGEYVRHLVLEVVGATHNIPVVKAYQGTAENMRGLMDAVATMENTEGFVVRFDDGHMAKVKCEWYVQLHRAKDVTKFEKNVLEIILEEKADDLLPLLEEPFKTMVIKYRDDVYTGIHEVADFMESEYQRILLALDYTKEKRRFAVHGVKNHSMTQFHSFFFTRFDKGDGMMGQLIGALKKSCSSQNRLDNNRWMMNGVTYNMAVSGDE
jgi:T4 RnlA family RNA ligase